MIFLNIQSLIKVDFVRLETLVKKKFKDTDIVAMFCNLKNLLWQNKFKKMLLRQGNLD